MSGTSALLNLLEGSGSALLNAPEATQTGVSEADSSYFVSLMKQYEGVEPLDDAVPSKERDPASELLGNGLPMPLPAPLMPHPVLGLPSVPTDIPAELALPSVSAPPLMAPPPVMLPPAVEAEADTRLEEFAVGLGIDRELARLLLRETSPQIAISDVAARARITPDLTSVTAPPEASPITALPGVPSIQVPITVSHEVVLNRDSTPVLSSPVERSSAPQTLAEIPVLPAMSPAASARSPRSLEPMSLDVTTSPLLTTPPVVNGVLQVSAAVDTPATVDGKVTERPVTPQTTAAPPSVISAVSSAAPSVISRAPAALNDEDVLRWRAFVHRSVSGLREPAQEAVASAQSVVDEVTDPLSGAPRRGLSEADFAAATASLRGFALERRQIVTTTATAVSSTMLSGDSPVDPAVLPMTGGMPMNAAAAPSFALGSPLAAQPDPLTTPLRVPDPTLQHELRAEQFAEQVGRRMLQQIREDRWTVNLQLDPQRLGPMDIELQLEGNQVTAQVGVANAEVRNLLEAALPKLRESLDSAGLNLANWSFAQSGAREYREFAQQSASVARKVATSSADVAIEDGNSRRVSDESASRVVDVYV